METFTFKEITSQIDSCCVWWVKAVIKPLVHSRPILCLVAPIKGNGDCKFTECRASEKNYQCYANRVMYTKIRLIAAERSKQSHTKWSCLQSKLLEQVQVKTICLWIFSAYTCPKLLSIKKIRFEWEWTQTRRLLGTERLFLTETTSRELIFKVSLPSCPEALKKS